MLPRMSEEAQLSALALVTDEDQSNGNRMAWLKNGDRVGKMERDWAEADLAMQACLEWLKNSDAKVPRTEYS